MYNPMMNKDRAPRPFEDLSGEDLKAKTAEAMAEVRRLQRASADLTEKVRVASQLHNAYRNEANWREVDERNNLPTKTGFYVVRVDEDSSRFFMYNGHQYIKDLVTDENINLADVPHTWTFKPFTTEDGYL